MYLPRDVQNIILSYNPDHRDQMKKVMHELLSNCVQREAYIDYDLKYYDYDQFYKDVHITTFHKSTDGKEFGAQHWIDSGYCSIYCTSLNYPHTCNFTECCNALPQFCDCK